MLAFDPVLLRGGIEAADHVSFVELNQCLVFLQIPIVEGELGAHGPLAPSLRKEAENPHQRPVNRKPVHPGAGVEGRGSHFAINSGQRAESTQRTLQCFLEL